MYKTFCNWSGGKDSALACYKALESGLYSIDQLITNLTIEDDRISMHHVPASLLNRQALALGIPLQKVYTTAQPSMTQYEKTITGTFKELRNLDYTHTLYGDIFLQDLKDYRDQQASINYLEAVFPLWKANTVDLLNSFVKLGFKAVIVCVDAAKLDKSFVGQIIDEDFISKLPGDIDPCGENGEFHTFVFDGPLFKHPVQYALGDYYNKQLIAPKSSNSQATQPSPVSSFWHRHIN